MLSNRLFTIDTDKIRLLCAALIPYSWDSIGIIGCTQYSRANVANPPENSAIFNNKFIDAF